ncbi:GFA family protein [Sporobolomyces salmoneus]|uniref:GFA family protein n=1 Tax=Sporobolomyces salmoneus TaxID=183962 RepID=UPI00317D75BD
MSQTYSSKCLCGASSITAKVEDSAPAITCSCTDCQKTSGTSQTSNYLLKEADVQIEGDIGKYTSKAASGNDVTRIFCKGCGSPFAHNSAAFGDSMAVQIGSLGVNKVVYGLELFTKDRWSGVAPIQGAEQKETA